ncbi:MAG: MFS transporter [Desulfobacterales bacterium]|nr:MFS transporter [Desulfobacterales bacterium]
MAEQRRLHLAWVILGVCFIDLFINYAVRLGYGVILPEMIQSLGFSRTQSGSIYNSYLLTYIAVAPFTGYLTDRVGARRVISACILIVGVGAALMGAVQNLLQACLFFGIAGLGSTGIWVPIITLIQRWFALPRKGMALGILSTGYGVGFAAMGVSFPWILSNFDWRFAWYVLGALGLLMVIPNALLLVSDPAERGLPAWGQNSHPSRPAGDRPARIRLARIWKDRNFWLIGFSYFSIAYCLYGFTTFMVDYANHQLNMPIDQASMVATIHGVAQVFGMLTVLPASDYMTRKTTILISNTVIALTLIGVLLSAGNWTGLCAMIGVLAVFYGATFPIYGACAGDYFPKEAIGTVAGAWTPFYGAGAILTHWVTGWLRDTTGVYDHAFLICAAMAAGSAVLMSLVKPKPLPYSEIASAPDVR